ncbi:FAD-dependent oxidoreductase [Bacillus luteolus]|uniref:FAD-dependent oxidoreductase n=1 Tax=Litchfieldia luteola TaxID=682179 RepID=A0ABR9QKQ1_9BACI|nr:NAD(P)/FAD-dependent oxidoreductase [Cytobacillus luteolus]MBE4909083.1 FAD-dependent oxidoreductase [Cytobacillus luteolus]MBP1941939.1 monoamine oxidase [Cytobacillus luteolus]
MEYTREDVYHSESRKNRSIAIVGGGLAGLTCAYRLATHGIMATVFEGNSRLGGRCWTERAMFKGSQFVERGGETIDSKHTSILSLIEELGLEVDDLIAAEKSYANPCYYYNGDNQYHQLQQELQEVARRLNNEYRRAEFPVLYYQFTNRAWELDNMSITDWIEQNIEGGEQSTVGQLLCTAYSIEHGADCSEQSALNLVQLFSDEQSTNSSVYGSADSRFRVSGGNDLLIKKLEEKLYNQIKRNHKLVSIIRNTNETYTLSFQSKGTIEKVHVDYVVLAIPFSVLSNSVDFSHSGFRPLKVNAINELGMGCNSKIHMQFDQRIWQQCNYNGTSYSNLGYQYTSDSTRAQSGLQGILVQISGGSNLKSMAEKGVDEYTREVIMELNQVFPGLQLSYTGLKSVDLWFKDKWAGGSYSFRKIGQFTRFAGVEMEREGCCFFAGEHTSVRFQGYMNGAVESGERVALEVIESLY